MQEDFTNNSTSTKYCRDCGAKILMNAEICPKCGCRQMSASESQKMNPDVSPKSRLAAALLCFFLGGIGVHRFYVGKTGTGIAMIFTLGGLGIWVLIDLIMILCGSFRDKNGKTLVSWE